MFQLEFYKKLNGEVPVAVFLKSLDIKMRTKATKEINLLEKYGNTLKEPHVKYIGDGILELRIKTGSNISRVFYFFYAHDSIVLTNGFIKKTQKTPVEEIQRAKKYKIDYIGRFNNEI